MVAPFLFFVLAGTGRYFGHGLIISFDFSFPDPFPFLGTNYRMMVVV